MEEEESRGAHQTKPESSQQDYEASMPLFYLMLTILLTVLWSSTFRELDRERGKLERQEQKIIKDIKSMAKTGQMVHNRCTNL